MERVEKARLELTAVIEPAVKVGATDEEPERLEMYRFGVETMEEHQIRVLDDVGSGAGGGDGAAGTAGVREAAIPKSLKHSIMKLEDCTQVVADGLVRCEL